MTRYWVRVTIALVICGLAIVGIDWGIYHLVRTGSCGSSSTYITYRPCPPGTGGHIMALIGGIFAGLAGIGVWATRGSRGQPSRVGLGLIMWSLLFVTLAASVAYAAYGPANNHNSGAKTTAIILGVIFVPMGLAPLPFAFSSGAGSTRTAVRPVVVTPRPATAVVMTASPPPDDEGDPLDRIAKLGELRDRGLITPEEFEAQKKRLLAEL